MAGISKTNLANLSRAGQLEQLRALPQDDATLEVLSEAVTTGEISVTQATELADQLDLGSQLTARLDAEGAAGYGQGRSGGIATAMQKLKSSSPFMAGLRATQNRASLSDAHGGSFAHIGRMMDLEPRIGRALVRWASAYKPV